MEDLLIYEWDEDKNQANIKKHGIDFATASLVFDDEYRIEIYDKLHSDNEDRYRTVGFVDDLLFVVYTERGNMIRLISARRANKWERRKYHDRNLY